MAPLTFDDELRRHLEEVERAPRPSPSPRHHVDADQLHVHFLQRLREREAVDPHWVQRIHREWAPLIGDFAKHIEELGHPDALGGPNATQSFATRALDMGLGCVDLETPLVTRLELENVARDFGRHRGVRRYAIETKLTRRNLEGDLAVTALGRTLLRLRGKDALRWLLIVEVLQSRGDFDPWHTGRNLLEKALEQDILPETDWDGSEHYPFDQNTLDRLLSCAVLHAHVSGPSDDADILFYFLPASMRDVVQTVLDDGPWHTAVAALLEDERSFVVPTQGPSATEATIEQTRMIAHEVRNALGPVRYNVDELLSEELEPHHHARVEAAKKGVVRVLDFIDQMVSTSELVTEPPTAFEVEALLREALGWIDGAQGVELDLPEPSLRLRAPRPRLLRALIDVIRNALLCATPAPPVRISASRHDREVRIMVDDGGPGVPAELRTRVFDDGFTTRPGGSGFGLAFLRQVVERELRGRVSCEDAPLGGARFTIVIPDAEPNP